ncbi:MAG: hypothetical protein WAT39_12865 [Planctomycetota bacterium]
MTITTEHRETPATLAEFYALKYVSDRLPKRANGNRLHPKVVVRWAIQGCQGVRLRFIAAGRQKLTCDAWLFQFLDEVARAQQSKGAAPPPRAGRSCPGAAPAATRRKSTQEQLTAFGFRARGGNGP